MSPTDERLPSFNASFEAELDEQAYKLDVVNVRKEPLVVSEEISSYVSAMTFEEKRYLSR